MSHVVRKTVLAILIFAIGIGPLCAYELVTHGKLTYEAFQKSVLDKDSALLQGLGIEGNEGTFGNDYFDIAGAVVQSRTGPEAFTGLIIEKDLELEDQSFTIAGWMMRGAIREDDYNKLNIGVCNVTPPNDGYDPDPYAFPPNRPIHHFFDPVNDEGLFPVFSERTPDWAIGTNDAFATNVVPDSSRRNHFTVFDAIEAM